jgi:intein/homing endonuclease
MLYSRRVIDEECAPVDLENLLRSDMGERDARIEQDLITRLRRKLLKLGEDDPATALPILEGTSSGGIERLLSAPSFEVTEEEIIDAVRETCSETDTADPHWEEATWTMIRSSCAFMAQELLRGPPEEPYCGRFFISEHHQEWDRLAYEHKRLCVLAARDHGKTYFFDFAYPIWQILRKPWGSGFIFSATQPQAERILGDIKYEIETNPRLQWLMPSRKDRWSSTSIRLSNGHRIFARGFGTKVRGAHPDWIVCDDVLNDETMYSELVRQKQIDYFYTAITNMIVPSGQIVVVGCVPLDTWVATEGGLRQIGELCPGELVPKALYPLDLKVPGRGGLQRATHFWVQGEVPTKRVFLEYGFELTGSHRHPFLVMGEDGRPGWKRADALRVGDYVAVQAGMNSWGEDILIRNPVRSKHYNSIELPKYVTPDLAYLVGLWTAEGSYEKKGRIGISSVEPEVRTWLEQAPFGLRFQPNTTVGSEQTLRCSSKAFLDFLEWLGAVLGRAESKVAPRRLMAAPENIARAFLQGFFDGDGCAYAKQHQIMAGTVSRQLAREVQLLLLNFGIVASLRKRPPAKPTKKAPNGGKHPLWVVSLTGAEAREFVLRVGFRLPRKNRTAQECLESNRSRVRGIPHQRKLIAQARKEKPRRVRGKVASFPPVNIAEVAKSARLSRALLSQVAGWFEEHGSHGLGVSGIRQNLAEPGLVWLKVKKIQGRKDFTVDFVLDGDHSFCGNGVVCHNTPFHKSDLYASLKENPEYHFQKYQAIDDSGKALWPDRYSASLLARRRAEIGAIRFTREFLCEPVSDDMSLFPGALFRGEPVEQFQLTLGMPKEFWDSLGVQIYVGVDFAMSSSVQADYTVIWVMGTDKFGNRWVIDIIRKKGLPYQEQLSLINEVGRRYDPALIFLESNQMQRIFGDELIRLTDLPIKEFTTGVQKNSLDKGVPSLRVLLENKKFRIPRGDRRSIEETEVWIDEMRSFTWAEGKLQSVGGHDDTVMGCWICDQAIRHGGFAFTFGDEYNKSPSREEIADLMRELTGAKDGGNGKDKVKVQADLVGNDSPSDSSWLPAPRGWL